MSHNAILYPLFGMFALVCIVAGTMLRRRIAFYKSNKVHPQKTALSSQMATVIADSRAADNFRNLFELPVLFYVVVLVVFVTRQTDVAFLSLAWAYVAARFAHSFIHCTSNTVMHRFYAFLASCTCLAIMWLLLAYRLLTTA